MAAYLIWIYRDDGPSLRQLLFGILVVAAMGVGTPMTMAWVAEHERGQLHDVTLHFVYKARPALVLDNLSPTMTRESKWTLVLWNLSHPNKNYDPLPIPTDTFGFIPSRTSTVPLDLFSRPPIASLISDGDVLFGSASVICPDCPHGHSFWVYIKLGEGGWYSEIPTPHAGIMWAPGNVQDAVNKTLPTIPEDKRIPIEDDPMPLQVPTNPPT